MKQVYRIPVGEIQTVCYLITNDKDECVVIDPGAEPDKIKKRIEDYKLKPQIILLTHGHYDHIEAINPLRKGYKIKALVHPADQELINDTYWARYLQRPFAEVASDGTFDDEQVIKAAGFEIKVIHTPGHSPGSSSFLLEDCLFSGDTLFAQGGVGRTDLWRSSFEDIRDSINNKLFVLPDHLKVYPGHGNSTTLGREKQIHQQF